MNILAGRLVHGITFWEYSVVIDFDPSGVITIGSGFVFRMADRLEEESTVPVRESRVMQAVGQEVLRARVIDDRHLCLAFKNGSELLIDGTNDGYECYQIRLGEREIII